LVLSRRWIAPLVVAAWTLGGLALSYYDRPLSDALWVMLGALWAVYWLGAVLVIAGLIYLVRRHRAPRGTRWNIAAMLLLAPTLWLSFRPLAAAGDDAQFERRFARLAPRYEAIAAQLERGGSIPSDGEVRGVPFVIDRGPPVRVAFPQPGGILDNWEGVIYDPSGVVRAARGWTFAQGRQDFSAPMAVRRLFGGDLVQCEPVRDDFYRCWFT